MAIRFNSSITTPTLTGQTAGSVINGAAVSVGDVQRQKARYLSAWVTGTAATASLTFTGTWQVSNDNVTWGTVTNGPQNAASVALATGTSSAFVKAVPAPAETAGYKFARFVVTTGGATAGVSDLLTVGYSYRTGPA